MMVAETFRIRRNALAEILEHARDDEPNECCGLLIGTADLAERAVRCRNVRASPTRFQLDPADHIAALKAVRNTARSVIGIYHSHPRSPPLPSETDLAEASYPEYVYCIVSAAAEGAKAEVRAYRLEQGNFCALELVPVG